MSKQSAAKYQVDRGTDAGRPHGPVVRHTLGSGRYRSPQFSLFGRVAALCGTLAAGSLLAFSSDAAAAQSVNFQQRASLVCASSPTNCRANFGEVAPNKRLEVSFVSCFLQFANTFDPNKAAFLGIDNANADKFKHTLLWEIRETGTSRITVVSQPVSLIVAAGKRPDISIPFPAFTTGVGECAISGTVTNAQ